MYVCERKEEGWVGGRWGRGRSRAEVRCWWRVYGDIFFFGGGASWEADNDGPLSPVMAGSNDVQRPDKRSNLSHNKPRFDGGVTKPLPLVNQDNNPPPPLS